MSWLFCTAAAKIMGSLESTCRCCSSDMAADTADTCAWCACAAAEAWWWPVGPGWPLGPGWTAAGTMSGGDKAVWGWI